MLLSRYPKVHDSLTKCAIGAKILLPFNDEENASVSTKDISPFLGQVGPVYLFNDAITPEQVVGIYSLGPSYMYSFLDNDYALSSDNPLPGGIFDAKDGLAPKIVFGLNAQVFFYLYFVPKDKSCQCCSLQTSPVFYVTGK